jgi:hypothetical protein
MVAGSAESWRAIAVAFLVRFDEGRPLMMRHRATASSRLGRPALPGGLLLGASVSLAVLILVLGRGRSPGLAGFSSNSRAEPSAHVVSAAEARARDALAARPMPETGSGHEYGYPKLSTRDPGVPIELPAAGSVDEFGVATGFSPTVPGALAQLAAIDVAAIQSGALPTVRSIIRAWAVPGGPTGENWSVLKAMAALLDGAGLSASGTDRLSVTVRPAMGLVKGTVGAGFAVVCIDLSVDIVLDGAGTQTATVDCQRMLRTHRRWMIGPGAEPAPAGSIWPGTDAALDAGFKELRAVGK